jgi:hypothetical protein
MSCVLVVCANVYAQTRQAAIRSSSEPGYNLIDGDHDGQFPRGERQI